MNQRIFTVAIGLAILGLVTLIYWPVTHATWIWDDHICFHDAAWLRYGDGWTRFVFQGFCDWTDYFRPLVVTVFAFEVQSFDTAPGPMHLVSLTIHLANMLLVGLLALRLSSTFKRSVTPVVAIGISMSFYGIHPLLVEPVFWIGSQAELILNFFVLLALLLNATVHHAIGRALAASACFFLAACSKESAISIPPLLLILDLMATRSGPNQPGWSLAFRSTWQRQWRVYVCLLLAGVLYLVFRIWALGYVLHPLGAESLITFARLQKVCYTYVVYWRMLVWPMIGLGPIHQFSEQGFAAINVGSLALDATALAIALSGLYLFAKRKLVGGMVLTVTVALFPVLHIIPIAFQESLYHERYAMTALAIACALLPSASFDLSLRSRARLFRFTMTVAAIAWLGLAVTNVRVTLPLWMDELKLWQWALRENPNSLFAKQQLLVSYIDKGEHVQARALADRMVATNLPCPICMLNAADLAFADGDVESAKVALNKLKDNNILAYNARFLHGYIRANGQLLELQGDAINAESAYRDAITLDTFDALPHMYLGLLLVRQGKVAEGRKETDLALALFAPDEREKNRKMIEQVFAASAPANPR